MKHHRDLRIARALRDLDPAGDHELTATEQERAKHLLARILASDPTTTSRPELEHSARQSRRWQRLVVVPAGIAAAAAVLVVVPSLTSNNGAYAGWTPTPEPLSPARAMAAADTCLERMAPTLTASTPVLAERRGDWSYVLVEAAGDREYGCFLHNDVIGEPLGEDETRIMGHGGAVDGGLDPGPRGLAENAGGIGSTEEGLFVFIDGYAGREVKSVTITSATGQTIEASLDNGRYAAWYPAGEAGADNPNQGGAWTTQATLSDGTVVTLLR